MARRKSYGGKFELNQVYEGNDRPFRFEDLEGQPDPERWGPLYSKPVKKRKLDVAPMPSNCASGQWFDFDAAKHRAKLRAEFTAAAAKESRDWADGKPRFGRKGDTIEAAYKEAMRLTEIHRAGLAAVARALSQLDLAA